MIKQIVIYSNNQHKIDEIRDIFSTLPVHVYGYIEAGYSFVEVVEDGQTLEENAIKKVAHFHPSKDSVFLSDDSGLEVEFLDGAPGVYSSRYAGDEASDQVNCEKVLRLLGNTPNRKAQFRTVIALSIPNRPIMTVSGKVLGQILFSPRGESGFGYDPIFQPEGYQQSFAEMSRKEKNAISHRHLALSEALLKLTPVLFPAS